MTRSIDKGSGRIYIDKYGIGIKINNGRNAGRRTG